MAGMDQGANCTPTLEVYAKFLNQKLNGARVLIVQSSKEQQLAMHLAECLQRYYSVAASALHPGVKDLGHAIERSSYTILVFNSWLGFAKKLQSQGEVLRAIGPKAVNELILVTKPSKQLEHQFRKFMDLSITDDPAELARKIVTVFGAPRPIAGATDSVKWSDQPTRIGLFRNDGSESLGLSIIARALHPSSPLQRITLIKEINEQSVASRQPQLRKYMHIQSINGYSLDNLSISEAARIIQAAGGSTVNLIVRYAQRDMEKVNQNRGSSVENLAAAGSSSSNGSGDNCRSHPRDLHHCYPAQPDGHTEQFSLSAAGTPLSPAQQQQQGTNHQVPYEQVVTGLVGGGPRGSRSSASSVQHPGTPWGTDEDVFNGTSGAGNVHQRPRELPPAARQQPSSYIGGMRKRGNSFVSLRWERKLQAVNLTGGKDGLNFSLSVVEFSKDEEHSSGVVVREVVDSVLRPNDLIYSIEDTIVMDCAISEVMDIVRQAKQQNSMVAVKYYRAVAGETPTSGMPTKDFQRSDEGISVEKYFNSLVGVDDYHYHSVFVLGSCPNAQKILELLSNGDISSNSDRQEETSDKTAPSNGSLLVQQCFDKDWQPVDEKIFDPEAKLDELSCEYVVSLIDHESIDLQLFPMSLMLHLFMTQSQVTIITIDLDSYSDDPFSEYTKLQSLLNIIYMHSHPMIGAQVVVIGVYQNLDEAKALDIVKVLASVARRFGATRSITIENDGMVVFPYKFDDPKSSRKVKDHLQKLVSGCVKAIYGRLAHNPNYYTLKQWPVMWHRVMLMSRQAPIVSLRSLDEPAKKYCLMERNTEPFQHLIENLQEHLPAHFFFYGNGKSLELHNESLLDPSIILNILTKTLPAAMENNRQFFNFETELYENSLVIGQGHLRYILGDLKKEIDSVIEWMIQLLAAFSFSIELDATSLDSSRGRSTSENVFVFLPMVDKYFTRKPIKQETLKNEFTSDDVWKIFVAAEEPFSAAFFYEVLTVLIKGAFECRVAYERTHCVRISSNGQLAVISYHMETSPNHFKLMAEFHELQQAIEIRLKSREQFQFNLFKKFVKQTLQDVCDKPHWRHMKRCLTYGYNPSKIDSKFKPIFHALNSLSDSSVEFPPILQFEMLHVFESTGKGHYLMASTPSLETPLSPQHNLLMSQNSQKYTHGKMDYPTFKVVSEILDSSSKWDDFADRLKLAGMFELARMHRYSMASQGMEILSRALSQRSLDEIVNTLSQLKLQMAVDIITKRVPKETFN